MDRPFRVPQGKVVGGLALVFSVGMILLYMPGSPAALIPVEWAIFGGWALLGLGMYLWSRNRYGVAYSDKAMGADAKAPMASRVNTAR